MAGKKIKSVLDKSTETRNKALLSNRGMYTLYDDTGSLSKVGEAFSVSDNFKSEHLTGGKDLFSFTHDGKSELSQAIQRHYDLGHAYRSDIDNAKRYNYNVYRPNGRGYLDYLDYVYGYGNFDTNYVNRLLTFLGNGVSEEEGRVGVVDRIDVESALNGFITTNPNVASLNTVGDIASILGNKWWDSADVSNFNEDNAADAMRSLRLAFAKTDTNLGVISNTTYARSLKKDAIISTERRNYRERNGLITALTPSTLTEYGNNLMTVTKLGDMMRVGPKGRAYLHNGPGSNVTFKHSISSEEMSNGIADNAGADFLIEYLKRDGYPMNKGDFPIRDRYYTPLADKGYYVSFNVKEPERLIFGDDEMPETNDGIRGALSVSSRADSNRKSITPVRPLGIDWSDNGDGDAAAKNRVFSGVVHFEYDEDDHLRGNKGTENEYEFNYNVIPENNKGKDLISVTNKLYQSKILRGMASFYKEVDPSDRSGIDSAYVETYGNSRGRNLLKKVPDSPNDYKNPYCRVWTYHHQYDRFSRAIRPFMKDDGTAYEIEEIQSFVKEYRSKGGSTYTNGAKYLAENTVLQRNGLVRIAPHWDSNNQQEEIKKCMFSIENLAWKDVNFGSSNNMPATKGPNGGRIMWFPPYGLSLNESVSVDWDRRTFIGRGEKVFTYSNTDRELRLDFIILVDHPSIIDKKVKHPSDENKGDYKYNGSVNDTELLRFIAGCGIFDGMSESGDDEGEQKVVALSSGDGMPREVGTEHFKEGESGKNKITFAVFFPNNYSGLDSATYLGRDPKQRRQTFLNYGGSDTKFMHMLSGYNAILPSVSGECRGYEVSKGEWEGISKKETAGENEILRACDVSYSLKTDFKDCEKSLSDEDGGTLKKFHYPVDFDLRQAFLKTDELEEEGGDTDFDSSYYDTRSFGFNSMVNEVKNNTNNNFSKNTCSFIDFINATSGQSRDFRLRYLSDKGDREISKEVREILENHKITKIEVIGGATHQDSKNAVELAKRRARNTAAEVVRYLEEFRRGSGMNDMDNVEIEYNKIFRNFFNGREDIAKSDTINSNVAKYQRCAQVHIYYENSSTEVAGSDYNMSSPKQSVPQYVKTVKTDDSHKRNESTPVATEYEYFQSIKENEPTVYKTIIQKFKRFDPAFHSITPEGFNARLSFLHQCTRQGHTISASENKGTYGTAPTAGNLAFGRMPVCVIRIGDFLNSRIIFNSFTVSYSDDGTQWDLNPEGIGVQPIFAKVTLNGNLIGGSSLSGPVNRLQNAQTFDYYANTGVYDDRSDRITNNSNGTTTYNHVYTPIFEQLEETDSVKKPKTT